MGDYTNKEEGSMNVIVHFSNHPEAIRSFDYCLSKDAMDFLCTSHVFLYTEKNMIRDLFLWIMSFAHLKDAYDFRSDEYLAGIISGVINDKTYRLNLDFSLAEYVKQNAVNNELLFQYNIGTGAGWGGNFNSMIKIFINSNEQKHARNPHVHIQKGKYKQGDEHSNTVRVQLGDELTIMNPENKKILSSKEWKKVFTFLEQYKELFRDNYKMIVKGVKPAEAWLNVDTGMAEFK